MILEKDVPIIDKSWKPRFLADVDKNEIDMAVKS